MATSGQTRKEVIIDFSVLNQDAVAAIESASKKIENLKKQQKLLEEEGLKNTETYIKNAAAIRDYTAVLKANEKELDNNIKAQRAEGDSLNAMRADLRSLTAQYADLSKAERESEAGASLLNQIDEQRVAVEELEHTLGDYGRQVGNYGKAVEGLGGPIGKVVGVFKNLSNGTLSVATAFKNGVGAVKAFSTQLLKLLANPIVAIIAAIAAVVMKLVQAFKKNDDAMTALQSAFAGFQPIINAVNKAFEFLVNAITKVLNGLAKLIAFIGGDASKEEQAQIKRIDELQEAERQYTVEHAKNEKEVSELRDKAADKEEYTAEQRKKFLDDAIAIEEKDTAERKRLAKERYETAKKEAQNNRDTSDETKDNLAQLEAAMYQADKEYADTHRKLIKEQQRFQREIDAEEEAAKKEREQKAREWEQKRKEREKQTLEETRKVEDLTLSLLTDGYQKQRKLLETAYARQIEDLEKRAETEKHIEKQLKEQIILLRAERLNKLAELDEKYSEQSLKEQLQHAQQLSQIRLNSMEDGYKKEMYSIELQRKKLTFENYKQYRELIELKKKYEKEGNKVEAGRIEKQIERADEIFNAEMSALSQREDEFKKSYDKQLQDLIGLNDLQQQLYNIEVDAYGKKESRKSTILQQEAEKRLKIEKTEQERLHKLLLQNPADQDLQLQYQQATQRVIDAQNNVKKATEATTEAIKGEKAALIQNFSQIASSLNNVLGAFNDMFTSMAESNEKYQKFATAMAISQIYVSMAASIAQAVQAAVQAGGFTGPAAPITIPTFIAELVAIVATTIGSTISTLNKAKASQTNPPRFSGGGLVGDHTTERTDDSVNARLTLGEYVIKSKKVKEYGVEFFDRINYGISKDSINSYRDGGLVSGVNVGLLRTTLQEVLLDMPNPIVDVREINRVQNKVKVKEIVAQ